MKKIALIALLFALSWQTYAQNFEDPNFKRNELKFDVVHLLLPAIKLEYEYFRNDWSSFGAVGLISFSSDSDNDIFFTNLKSQLLGFYRLYFGKNPMRGFFLEGNLGISSGTYEHRSGGLFSPRETKPYTAFGVGIALGWKFHIPKSDVVLDIFSGMGRLFHDDAGFYQRVGICVGKRF